MASRSASAEAVVAALACIAVVAATADATLLPWFGGRGGAPDDGAPAPALSGVGLQLADPFRILEQVPFGFDRDDVAMLSMARVDWRETADAHEIVVDVPGMRKEDLRVEIEENRLLRISGERLREEERKGDHWHREERSHGRFWRQLRLPDNADLDDGVLTVRFRKLAPDQIKGPRVIGIVGGDDSKKSIGAAGKDNHKGKKVEL
ncbi:hypothetical protein ABZP36_002735 [Zizania latifolia]